MTHEEEHLDMLKRVAALEREAIAAANERTSLRRLAERNESTLQQILKAFKGLAESQKTASEQASAALTIVQNALVLRQSVAPETQPNDSAAAAPSASSAIDPQGADDDGAPR